MIFKNRNFSIYWFTQTLSMIASTFHVLALPIWVFQITGSPLKTGLVTLATYLPGLIMAPFAGVIVDRMNKRMILILSDLLEGVLVGCLFFVNSNDNFWIVYVVAVGTGLLSSFFFPSQSALVQGVVEKEHLGKANSVLQVSSSAAFIMGPLLGAVFLQSMGVKNTFLLNALSFFIAAIGTALIRYPHEEDQRATGKMNVLGDLFEGLRLIKQSAEISKTLFSQFMMNLGIGANALFVVVLLQSTEADSNRVALYMSANGLGSLIGAVLFERYNKFFVKMWNSLLFSFLCIGIFEALFIQTIARLEVLGVACMFMIGAFVTIFMIASRTTLQQTTPPHAIGRVSAISGLLIRLGISLAVLIGGSIATLLDPRTYGTFGGALIIMLTIWLFRTQQRRTTSAELSSEVGS